MRSEAIGEPIRVLAAFSGGRIQPLRFRWSGRAYKIDAINARWVDRQGDHYSLHYSVQVGSAAPPGPRGRRRGLGQIYALPTSEVISIFWRNRPGTPLTAPVGGRIVMLGVCSDRLAGETERHNLV